MAGVAEAACRARAAPGLQTDGESVDGHDGRHEDATIADEADRPDDCGANDSPKSELDVISPIEKWRPEFAEIREQLQKKIVASGAVANSVNTDTRGSSAPFPIGDSGPNNVSVEKKKKQKRKKRKRRKEFKSAAPSPNQLSSPSINTQLELIFSKLDQICSNQENIIERLSALEVEKSASGTVTELAKESSKLEEVVHEVTAAIFSRR